MNNSTVPDFSAIDLARMLCAVLIAAAGALACLFFLARRKRKDDSLLYFGVLALLYGVRLFINGSAAYMHNRWERIDLEISLLAPMPLVLFVVETVAPRWKKLAWWLIGLLSAIAAFGFGCLLLGRELRIVGVTTNIMALAAIPMLLGMLFIPFQSTGRDQRILRAGFLVFLMFVAYTNLVSIAVLPGSPGLEFIGFGFFLSCLGYVAASRTQRNEERLFSLNKEMEIARGIQAGLLPEKSFNFGRLVVASSYVPASSVAGDFYDFLRQEDGLGVLIADVSGHGVPAALSASMVKVAIRAQRHCVQEPAPVLTGLNSILCGNLQGQFVTAGYLFLNPARGTLAYAGAGHPPLLVWRAREKKVETIEENGLMLGIFPESAYKSMSAALEPGDRFVLYTDGIVEAPNSSGEEFGMERFKGFLAEHSAQPAQEFCDALVQHVAAWCGSNEEREQHDDLTLIVIDYKVA